MEWIQVIILSIVQGLTEFLPISSSAHLVLVPKFIGWKDQGLAFDVATHVGTLLAVLFYFKYEIISLLRDLFRSIVKRQTVGESTLAWAVLLGTIPVGLVGLVFNGAIEQYMRSPQIIAYMTIFFGIVLYVADVRAGEKETSKITIGVALLVGIAQAFALIPGTSRSGVTMSAAMLLGFSRVASARFSFLLSIPVIVLAGGLKIIELIQSEVAVEWSVLFGAIGISAISAYVCIYWFMDLISRSSMLPFVIYRLILGAVLFAVFM